MAYFRNAVAVLSLLIFMALVAGCIRSFTSTTLVDIRTKSAVYHFVSSRGVFYCGWWTLDDLDKADAKLSLDVQNGVLYFSDDGRVVGFDEGNGEEPNQTRFVIVNVVASQFISIFLFVVIAVVAVRGKYPRFTLRTLLISVAVLSAALAFAISINRAYTP